MTSQARILLFDIEATDLEASFGHVLCFGYQYLQDRTARVISLQDYPPRRRFQEEPDKQLLKRVHTILQDEADIIVTFYGKEYDRKFLNSRMLMSGLSPLPPLSSEHVDLYYTCRGNLRLHSNRLQAVSESLGCPLSKTPVRADVWRLAARGEPRAMQYVLDHCQRDVQILKWTYLKLRPFVRQHPPVTANALACRVCGGLALESRGHRFRFGHTDQRLRCRACGTWTYQTVDGKRLLR